MMQPRERFLAALRGEAVDRPPVWLMRQAGRYLPGYRALREAHSFWEICHEPVLATQAALEPIERFELDAAIVFSDILVVPQALGLGVSLGLGEGPRIERPLRGPSDLSAWNLQDIDTRLAFVSRAVGHLHAALDGRNGLVGFAGAPFTLFAYCVEGGGSDDFRRARNLLHIEPVLAKLALTLLADVVADLLLAQIDAGADAVQLFESWGGLLAPDEYTRFALPAVQRIADRLSAREAPLLLFVRGGHHLLPQLADSGAAGFSLDWRTDWTLARREFPQRILQGNLDPVLLLGNADVVRARTEELLRAMRATSDCRRSIVNLGHGILPSTAPDNVAALVDAVREFG